jgi:hypothetical protein
VQQSELRLEMSGKGLNHGRHGGAAIRKIGSVKYDPDPYGDADDDEE